MRLLSTAAKPGVSGAPPRALLPSRASAAAPSNSRSSSSSRSRASGRTAPAPWMADGYAMPLWGRASRPRRGGLAPVCSSRIDVEFVLPNEVSYGECHALLGSDRKMGDWRQEKAFKMKWGDGHVWTAVVPLKPGTECEFKCVKVSEGGVEWEDGNNRTFKVPSEGPVKVDMNWGKTEKMLVASAGGEPQEVASRQPPPPPPQQPDSIMGSMDGDRLDHEQWAGRQVEFMTENRHSGERNGTWDTDGLEGAALTLVNGDCKSGSWLQKLQVVKGLLVDDADRKRPRLDALVNASAYLLWINTGAIVCVEGGGHYRPNRHAEISREIFRSLEWVLGDPDRTLQEKLVARRLHPRLPSFSAEFTASVPLTRIRDIAHRNDIPHDLKREIKHTLQNKLHRNAGPEDLIATEEMLRRITANHGEYSHGFVEEFKVFYGELKDFFNAGTLIDMLDDLKSSLDNGQENIIQQFVNAKQKVDASMPSPSLQDVMEALHCTTTLRALLVSGLASGLRNDTADDALAMRQTWRLCEIRAEDYTFVLLSIVENILEHGGGHGALSSSRDRDWALPIGAAVLGLRQMGLSGWYPGECAALEAELEAWQRMGFLVEREQALRIKATLERCLRLTEDYAEMMLQIHPKPVAALGKALGVDGYLQTVYTEAEIRAGVIFQLSKLATLLSRASRIASGSGSWDVVVGGVAEGLLVEMEVFDPAAVHEVAAGKDVILLVKRATGDEEVAGEGHLKGIILEQDIPHLSHLGVRARQEGVTFVTSEEAEALRDIRSLVGKVVSLEAGPDGAKVSESSGAPAGSNKQQNKEKIATVLKKGSEELPDATKDRDGVLETLVKGIEIIKEEAAVGGGDGATDLGGLTFSFCENAADTVMSDEELLALMMMRKEGGGGGNGSSADGAAAAGGAAAGGNGGEVQKASGQEVVPLAEATVGRCGSKAAACALLLGIAESSKGSFEAPGGAVIPFGVMDLAIEASGQKARFDELLAAIETQEPGEALDSACTELQALVAASSPGDSVIKAAAELLPGCATIARSSANVEDLAGMSGAGLYESIPNKGPSEDPEDFGRAVSQVWASLYTRRAVMARRAAGVPQAEASMAVLVMPLLEPETSFVLHTVRPVDRNPDILYAEVAPGQGELLASGGRGTPWRLSVDKSSGNTVTTAFANFSRAMVVKEGRLVDKTMVYAQEQLSCDADFRTSLGKQLMEVGVALEDALGGPQDVEGALVGGKLYIVQSRPQP